MGIQTGMDMFGRLPAVLRSQSSGFLSLPTRPYVSCMHEIQIGVKNMVEAAAQRDSNTLARDQGTRSRPERHHRQWEHS